MSELAEQTLGTIAADNPAATRVFLRYRLDFCCGGGETLAEACEHAGIDPTQVASEIERAVGNGEDLVAWQDAPVDQLIDHICERYHVAHRRDVPGLLEAARKVERVHAGKPLVPAGLADLLETFWGEMQSHMAKEEQILFPMLRAGARGDQVEPPIEVMKMEHDDHGANLQRIRSITGDFEAPAHACATWRALYEGLATLEEDLMQHVHLENHVLFPRALEEPSRSAWH